jgi:hypothetical protein
MDRRETVIQKRFVAATDGEIWRESHADPYEDENEMMRMNPDE